MIILVDLDDTLETLAAGWVQYLDDKYNLDVKSSDVTSWDFCSAFPMLTHEQVAAAELDDRLWDYVKPIPGASAVLQKLISEGHEIFIVTATIYQTLRSKMEKVLFAYYPFIDWSHVIVTPHKERVTGDVLIDDGPHNMTSDNYKKILFTAHHNKSFDESSVGAVRADSWDEVYEIISRMNCAEE